MEEKFFIPIDKLAKQSLPAIATHAPQIGLFAGSIELNTKAEKYNLFATTGEATPIAFERQETMAAFVRHLYTVATTGQDMTYQPTMRASEALKGKILIYSNADLKLPYEATQLPTPPDSGTAYEIANLIGSEAELNEAKIVIIDDATQLLANDTRDKVTMLNSIADLQGFMLLYGCNVMEATDNTLDYISRHAHNLCQLTEGSIELANDEAEPQAVNYFCFTYGRPTPHRIVYSIDESGDVQIPQTPITDLIRMEGCAKELASTPIQQDKFVDRAVGYFHGEFQPASIYNMITAAAEQGTINRSGEKSKVTIQWADGKPKRNPYKGNIALTALGDASSKATNYTAKRKAVAKFGEFKLLHMDTDIPAHMGKNFMAYLLKAIATKRQAFGRCIEVKSAHRNTLVIVIGEKETADRLQAYIGEPTNADFEFVSTNGSITDGDLLHLYRARANQKPRDFVVIVGLNDATQADYTPLQLAHELAITAKRRGFLAIAQTSGWTYKDLAQFTGDEVWSIRPVISNADREGMEAEHGISFPDYYIFDATAGSFPFRGKFTSSGSKPNRDDFKKALLTSMFFYCKRTLAEDTGATESQIRQAKKLGLINVEPTNGKKRWSEMLITFVGK